ncbi:MAG: nucleotidyltransferase family protein [Oscillospiraceae bacterium]|jgi:predicted nucleotidyltransferase
MSVAGIVSEYNPFHMGHVRHIELTREALPGCSIVAVMSGNVVQRGEFAIMQKHARAEAAVRGGCDLVLELPAAWALSSSEGFAAAAVYLLGALGQVTHLSFGCEAGSIDPLREVADALLNERFPELLREELSSGQSFASARQKAAEKVLGRACSFMSKPNNILAIDYLKALQALSLNLEPVAIKREGGAHDGKGGKYPSAMEIRELLFCGKEIPYSFLPEGSRKVLAREVEAGRAPVNYVNSERAILARLRALGDEELMVADNSGEGLWRRFKQAAGSCTSVEGIIEAVKSKRYAHSRIRRMLMRAYLGLGVPAGRPPYLRVLAANSAGRELLRSASKTASLPIITKPAHVRRLSGEAQKAFLGEVRVTSLCSLAAPDISAITPLDEWKRGPVML